MPKAKIRRKIQFGLAIMLFTDEKLSITSIRKHIKIKIKNTKIKLSIT